MKRRLACLSCLLVCPAFGDVVFDEAVEGDFSGSPTAPTDLGSIADPVLILQGSVQSGSAGDVRDYVTFEVPEGSTLDAARLLRYVDGTTGQSGNTGYCFLDSGSTSVIPSANTSGSFLGGSHLNRARFADATVNMLDRLSSGVQGGTGFSLPLGPGAYTFEVQQTGSQRNVYEIRFEFTLAADECVGDFDGNGRVDGGDLGSFLGVWGTNPCTFDLDGDGTCNGADLGILLGAWGGCSGG